MKTSPRSLALPCRSLVIALGYVAGFFCLLPATLFGLGRRIDALLGFERIPALVPFGLVLLSFGTVFMLVSMVGLSVRGRGLPMSHLPPTLLVTQGLYSHFRHPIYVGYTIAFAGLGSCAGSLGIGVGASLLLAITAVIYALGFEEPRLVRRHGERFAEYSRSVRLFPGSGLLANAAVRAWRRVSPLFQRFADRPILFRVGPTLWVTFGLFAGLGAFAATALCAASLEPRYGEKPANTLVLGATLATLGGGWLVARLYRLASLIERPLEELRRVGFVSWGGYVGLIGSTLAIAHAFRMPLVEVLDLTLPSSLFASAIGRLGCLSYGCCGGRPCEHGILWRHPESRVVREFGSAASVPRVPTQLLSSLHALATFALVAALSGRARPGAPTLFVMILYSLGRFVIEFLREEPRYPPFELTRGQIACAAVCSLSLLGLLGLPAAGLAAPLHFSMSAPLTLVAPLASGALAFAVCGVHLRRVGSW
jgi:phosphatidylglycerol:prolipoprotein diacylglycerol transferase